MPRRLLFVDDEPIIRITLKAVLANHGYDVTTAATVAEALEKITQEKFEVLLSDLNIGNPGDGLTVVSAMRRTQPDAVTIILTGFPAFETALEAIRQQVDDYIVKPAHIPSLLQTIESKLAAGPRQRQSAPPKRVAMILQENMDRVKELWLAAIPGHRLLSPFPAPGEPRISRILSVLENVIRAAQIYSGEEAPQHTAARGNLGSSSHDGFDAKMILADFCLLRRAIAQVIQENLLSVNLSYLIPDLSSVNESLDEQAQAAVAERLDGDAALIR